MSTLLAVDAGLRTGLALYGGDGKLLWYRSRHFGTTTQLKRAINRTFREIQDCDTLVIEGSVDILDAWVNAARKSDIKAKIVNAEAWRQKLLYIRERRSGASAKHFADGLARQVIFWSGMPRPTLLIPDTAEAILIGLWGVLEYGILKELPEEFHRH